HHVGVFEILHDDAVQCFHEAVHGTVELVGVDEEIDGRLALAGRGIIDVLVLERTGGVKNLDFRHFPSLVGPGSDVLRPGRRDQRGAGQGQHYEVSHGLAPARLWYEFAAGLLYRKARQTGWHLYPKKWITKRSRGRTATGHAAWPGRHRPASRG